MREQADLEQPMRRARELVRVKGGTSADWLRLSVAQKGAYIDYDGSIRWGAQVADGCAERSSTGQRKGTKLRRFLCLVGVVAIAILIWSANSYDVAVTDSSVPLWVKIGSEWGMIPATAVVILLVYALKKD